MTPSPETLDPWVTKLSGTSVSDAVETKRTSHSRIVRDRDVALLKINVRVTIIFVFHPFITF